MKKKIYLISPKNPENFWTMQSSVEAVGVKTLMPNAALATLIALTPKELDIEYSYCDENVSKINFRKKCDLVVLTGYTLHEKRISEISEHFRGKKVPVALGGPFATLYPDRAQKLCDHLFIREGEHTWPAFLREWVHGEAGPLYVQNEFIDMKESPAPDWSFIRGSDYLYFALQTSRGCPNNCDFCDAIRLTGRKYRHKTVDQVMVEINNAYRAGAETVFFSEDNFFVNKKFTTELLQEIIAWNTRQPRPLSFSCQATIKIGEDEGILKMLADARFSVIFLGVESIRMECLEEVNKGHLFRYDPVQAVKNLSRYGILPFVGLIVGFDHDNDRTFHEIKNFLDETATPIASISVLNAPEGTRLHQRMKEQGRIYEDFGGLWHFTTNIVPASMSFNDLIGRHRALFKKIYEPAEFEKRTIAWLSNIRYVTDLYRDSSTNMSKLKKFFPILKYYLFREPKEVRALFFRMLKSSWGINPRLIKKAITIMTQYCHYHAYAEDSARNMHKLMR